MNDDEYVLVCCKACGALRSSRWEECFCHETATKPAPPPDKDLADLLREQDRQGHF